MTEALPERVRRTIERDRLVEKGQRIGVAVSGGADSVALLHLLHQVAPELGITLRVIHVNHKLRGAESDADAEFVAELAREYGLPFDSEARVPAEGENIEQGARQARLFFFHELIRTGAVARVATAHTRDDQAETVLFRILRGSGPGGLAGILPVTAEGVIRPVLGVTRAELREWLGERAYREDRSNEDLGFARNRIRLDLLPRLEAEWNPGIAGLLAQMAELAREDENHFATEVERVAAAALHRKRGAVLIDLPELGRQSRALQRRLIRRGLAELKGDLRRVDFRHVEAALDLAHSPLGDGRFQVPGVDVFRSFDKMRLAEPATAPRDRNWSIAVLEPGEYRYPGGSLTVEIAHGATGEYTDRQKSVGPPFVLRNWRPGDAYTRMDSERADSRHTLEKVKDLFQIFRIPLWERRDWPILTQGDRIIWAHRFGIAAEAAQAGLRLTVREEG